MTLSENQELEQMLEPLKRERLALVGRHGNMDRNEKRRYQAIWPIQNAMKRKYFDGLVPLYSKQFAVIPGKPFDIRIPFMGKEIRYRGIAGHQISNAGERIRNHSDPDDLWTTLLSKFTYGEEYMTSLGRGGTLSESFAVINPISSNASHKFWVVITVDMTR